jgi:hypothetical protein
MEGMGAYLAHFPHGDPLSQARFKRLHSRQLCCGFVAGEWEEGDEAGDDEVADMIQGCCWSIQLCSTNTANRTVGYGTLASREGRLVASHAETASHGHVIKD